MWSSPSEAGRSTTGEGAGPECDRDATEHLGPCPLWPPRRLAIGAIRSGCVIPGDEMMKALLKFRPDLHASELEDRLVPVSGLGVIVLTTSGYVLVTPVA